MITIHSSVTPVIPPDVYSDFSKWLTSLGIKRDYSANLRSINNNLISKATGIGNYIEQLYSEVIAGQNNVGIVVGHKLICDIITFEQKTGFYKTNLSNRYLRDCKSAIKKFNWFLISKKDSVQRQPIVNKNIPSNIIWSTKNPIVDINGNSRLTTQNRVNNTSQVNFPIRIINEIATNAEKWADLAQLPKNHPARAVKKVKQEWVDSSLNNTVVLIDGDRHVILQDIDSFGTAQLASGKKYVYIRMKNSGDIHQVYSRNVSDQTYPMTLAANEDFSAMVLDHVYRMQDILNDLGDAFPFLKKLTRLIRQFKIGNIGSTETKNNVLQHIDQNFATIYAGDMQQLIDDLNKIGRVVSLELMYHKDNLKKH